MFWSSSKESKPTKPFQFCDKLEGDRIGTWPGGKQQPLSRQRNSAIRQQPRGYYEEAQSSSPMSQTSYGRDFYPNAPSPQSNGLGAAFKALDIEYHQLDRAAGETEAEYRTFVNVKKAGKGVPPQVVKKNPSAYVRNGQGDFHTFAFHAQAAAFALKAAQFAGRANELRNLMARTYPAYEQSLDDIIGHRTRAQKMLGISQKMTVKYNMHTALSQGKQPSR